MRIQPPIFESIEFLANLCILRERNILPIQCPFCEIEQVEFWYPSDYYNHVDINHNNQLDVACDDPDCDGALFDNLTIFFPQFAISSRSKCTIFYK